MLKIPRTFAVLVIAGALFFAGYAAAQNHFGQPKTVLAISLIKFNPGVSDADADRVINAIPKMAAQIPGIKNIWIKPARMEPRDFDAAFVIEFVDRAAADRYAESPIHDAWSKQLQQIRFTSISPQITNP
jgi:hypothetical protein